MEVTCKDCSLFDLHTVDSVRETAQALALRAAGATSAAQLQEIMKVATIKPAVNQIQYNVFSHDEDTIAFCHANNITVEAWSPMAPPYSSKSVFKEPTMTSIANQRRT